MQPRPLEARGTSSELDELASASSHEHRDTSAPPRRLRASQTVTGDLTHHDPTFAGPHGQVSALSLMHPVIQTHYDDVNCSGGFKPNSYNAINDARRTSPNNNSQTYHADLPPESSSSIVGASAPTSSLANRPTATALSLRPIKVTLGMKATSMHSETDPVVREKIGQVMLVGNDVPLSFLSNIAFNAKNILATIETINEGRVQRDILNLALQAHALVFVVIIQCEKRKPQENELAHFESLERILKDIHAFCATVFLRNPMTKQSEKYKDRLETWWATFNKGEKKDITESFSDIFFEYRVHYDSMLES